jgi:3-isopropylmalate/(R)-2-methylmalate dehydratase small subunit
VAIEIIREVSGTALPLPGDNIDTDRIIPARFLKSISFEGLEEHLFEDDRAQVEAQGFERHPFSDARYDAATILVVNANFGCGSSREHAPQALQRWGIQAVIGESFAEIFFQNSTMIGLACVTASPADVRSLMDRTDAQPLTLVEVDIATGRCKAEDFQCAVSLPPNVRDALMTGAWDTTGMLLDRYEEVDAAAARLPYLQW